MALIHGSRHSTAFFKKFVTDNNLGIKKENTGIGDQSCIVQPKARCIRIRRSRVKRFNEVFSRAEFTDTCHILQTNKLAAICRDPKHNSYARWLHNVLALKLPCVIPASDLRSTREELECIRDSCGLT